MTDLPNPLIREYVGPAEPAPVSDDCRVESVVELPKGYRQFDFSDGARMTVLTTAYPDPSILTAEWALDEHRRSQLEMIEELAELAEEDDE